MKKNICLLLTLILSLFAFTFGVNAEEKSETLQEAVQDEINAFGSVDGYQEDVEKLKNADLSEYSNSNEKVNIYIFRGQTCPHCLDAIVFFAQKAKEYGKYFNIVSYEVWNNTSNAKLMNKVSARLGEQSSGVPYIVVGNKSYSGFGDNTGDEILKEVQSIYNSTDKYDIFDHLGEAKTSTTVVIILVVLVVLVGIGFIVYVSKSKD